MLYHSLSATDVVRDLDVGDDRHGASIAVRHEGEEDTVEELLGDGRVIERVCNVGLAGVVGIELGVDTFHGRDIVCVGRGGDGTPPLVGDLPGGEDPDVAGGPVVVDLLCMNMSQQAL